MLSKKLKNNSKQFFSNLYNVKCLRGIRNILSFYSPIILMNTYLVYSNLLNIRDNIYRTIILFVLLLGLYIFQIKYFSASVPYDKYEYVKIYFSHTYSDLEFKYRDFSHEENYITIRSQDNPRLLIQYNKDLINKIEFFGYENIEEKYSKYLEGRGFKK